MTDFDHFSQRVSYFAQESRRRTLPPESRVRTDSTGIVNKRNSSKTTSNVGHDKPELQDEASETVQPATISRRRPTIRPSYSYNRRELLDIRMEDPPLAEPSISEQLASLGLSRSVEKKSPPRPKSISFENKHTLLEAVSESPTEDFEASEDNLFLLTLFGPMNGKAISPAPKIVSEKRKTPKEKRRVRFAVPQKDACDEVKQFGRTVLISDE